MSRFGRLDRPDPCGGQFSGVVVTAKTDGCPMDHDPTPSDLEIRLRRLERERRFSHTIGFMSVLVLTVLVSTGFISRDGARETVQADRVIVGGEGNSGRIELSLNGDEPRIQWIDLDGKTRVHFSADGLTFSDEAGNPRAFYGADEVQLYDASRQPRVALRVDGETGNSRLEFMDLATGTLLSISLSKAVQAAYMPKIELANQRGVMLSLHSTDVGGSIQVGHSRWTKNISIDSGTLGPGPMIVVSDDDVGRSTVITPDGVAEWEADGVNPPGPRPDDADAPPDPRQEAAVGTEP